MTYHLARVANWIQNQSVSYYPTNIDRQLYSPVLAEYIILHTYLLAGSDTFANMIQFFAYLLSSILIYMIGTKLNLHKATRYFMVVLFITIPMAIAQSMTTQTDLVGTLWLLAFAYITIDFLQQKELKFNKDSFYLVLEGAAICALAFLSKGSVCPGICVFLALIAFQYIHKKTKILPLCTFGIMACFIVCSLTLPTFYRNYNYTGDIFASDYMGKVAIGNKDPKFLLLNLAKNYALLATSPHVHNVLSSTVINLSKFLNIDVNHPDISWTRNFENEITSTAFSFHHDTISCALLSITWLICCIILCYFVFIKKICVQDKQFILACICSICVGLITIRYQTWGNRLLLPYCALMVIVIGWTMNLIHKRGKIFLFTILILSLAAISSAYRTLSVQLNYFIPTDRTVRYFVNNFAFYSAYKDLTQYVISSDTSPNVGILLGEDTWEYPLWKMLPDKNIIQIVPNKSCCIAPNYIIAINRDIEPSTNFMYLGRKYKPVHFYQRNNQFSILALSSLQETNSKNEKNNKLPQKHKTKEIKR